jgi:hypothetical protein
VLGPLCASVLIATEGTGWCFRATAASYLVSVVALKPIMRSALCTAYANTQPGTALAGFHYAWRTPELRVALILTGAVAMFGFNHRVLVPLLATKTFHGGTGAYTLLYCASFVNKGYPPTDSA